MKHDLDCTRKAIASYNTNPMHISHATALSLFGGIGGLQLRIQNKDGMCLFEDMAHGFCAVTTILRRRFSNRLFTVYEAVQYWERTYSCRKEDFSKEFFKNSTLDKYLKLRVTKQEPMIRLMRDMCITETGGFTPPESTVSTGYSYSFSMPTVAPSYVPFVIERDNTGLS